MNFLSTLKNIGIEAKTSAFFAVLALFFSVLIGTINGINAGAVILRSVILTVLFAGLGFAITAVLKKYVPEFYALLTEPASTGPESERADAAGGEVPPEGFSEASGAEDTAVPAEDSGKDPGIIPVSDDDFNKMLGEGGAESKRKLGKHIISNEKIISYEPKIMAQAVRTMMKRDED